MDGAVGWRRARQINEPPRRLLLLQFQKKSAAAGSVIHYTEKSHQLHGLCFARSVIYVGSGSEINNVIQKQPMNCQNKRTNMLPKSHFLKWVAFLN